ncbi:hypothetical protein SPRG_16552, partial [Saprolegnia parasitica CBS 223.65]
MPIPNVIIQIAYKNKNLYGRREKLDLWMHPDTSVQVAIGVMIFHRGKHRVAILHQRGHGTTELEFGQRRAETHGLVTEKE